MSLLSKTPAPTNSAATPTASKKAAGERESGSTPSDGQLSRDGRFRWSGPWSQWVPTGKEIREPPQQTDFLESAKPVARHSPSCLCDACLTAGQHYLDYQRLKADPWR